MGDANGFIWAEVYCKDHNCLLANEVARFQEITLFARRVNRQAYIKRSCQLPCRVTSTTVQ